MLSHVSYPRQGVIAGLLDDAQVPHLDAGSGVVRYFEFDGDRRPRVLLLRDDGRQLEAGQQKELFAARKQFDVPHHLVLLRHVLGTADGQPKGRRVDVVSHRNLDDHVDRGRSALEVGVRLHNVLHTRMFPLVDRTLDRNRRLADRIDSIAHQLELTVRRNETDGSIAFKVEQSHTLVQLDILQLDAARLAASLMLVQELVVQAQLEFRHSGQKHVQLDASCSMVE
jgi:hypothetical protein